VDGLIMIWRFFTRGEPLLNDLVLFKNKKILCMKTLKGMLGGMFCENQPMLAHDILEKKRKGTSVFCDGYVMILMIKFLIKSCFLIKSFSKYVRENNVVVSILVMQHPIATTRRDAHLAVAPCHAATCSCCNTFVLHHPHAMTPPTAKLIMMPGLLDMNSPI